LPYFQGKFGKIEPALTSNSPGRTPLARHHHYSKRSRESRKAMSNGLTDLPGYPDTDDAAAEDWQLTADEPDPPPGPAA